MIGAPVLLTPEHLVETFSSGYPTLDDWLKKRAVPNQSSGASRTYIVEAEGRVVGYFALAVGSTIASEAPGKIRRNMPDPVPVMILARLAIDQNWQGQGLGSGLLREAILRTAQVARIAGVRAMLVHATDRDAAKFYERAGFVESTHRPLAYFMLIHPPV
ncbi:GNAT family N-acetyltransferase [Rhizobium sp.]